MQDRPEPSLNARPAKSQRILGLVLGIAIILAIGAAVLWYRSPGKRVKISDVESVYYSGDATEKDARALGDALKNAGWFKGEHEVAALLYEGPKGTIVSLVTKPSAWEDPHSEAFFQSLGKQVAPAVGGPPITLRLIDRDRTVKKEIQIQ